MLLHNGKHMEEVSMKACMNPGQRRGFSKAIRDTGRRERDCVVYEWECACGGKWEGVIDQKGVNLCPACRKSVWKRRLSESWMLERKRRQSVFAKEMGRANKRDLVGLKFGLLTVLRDTGLRDSQRRVLWECECECGNHVVTAGGYLKNGRRSCGKCSKAYCKPWEVEVERV